MFININIKRIMGGKSHSQKKRSHFQAIRIGINNNLYHYKDIQNKKITTYKYIDNENSISSISSILPRLIRPPKGTFEFSTSFNPNILSNKEFENFLSIKKKDNNFDLIISEDIIKEAKRSVDETFGYFLCILEDNSIVLTDSNNNTILKNNDAEKFYNKINKIDENFFNIKQIVERQYINEKNTEFILKNVDIEYSDEATTLKKKLATSEYFNKLLRELKEQNDENNNLLIWSIENFLDKKKKIGLIVKLNEYKYDNIDTSKFDISSINNSEDLLNKLRVNSDTVNNPKNVINVNNPNNPKSSLTLDQYKKLKNNYILVNNPKSQERIPIISESKAFYLKDVYLKDVFENLDKSKLVNLKQHIYFLKIGDQDYGDDNLYSFSFAIIKDGNIAFYESLVDTNNITQTLDRFFKLKYPKSKKALLKENI